MIARRPGAIEYALIATGIVCAATSAAFALYMTNAADRVPTFAGGEHLRIFAQPSSRGQRALREIAAPAVDMNPTGSIDAAEPARAPLPGWWVQDADSQSALILGPQGLVRAARGVDLGEAGVVLRIEIGRQGWSVVTTRGVIASMR